jgi:Rrf2 family protein
VQVNAKVDYALRALAELANAGPGPVKAETIAKAQGIPLKFLENILLELRHAGIVISQRGAVGGYRLGHEPSEITLADVIRVVDGPLANVRGLSPERLEYHGPATALRDVWIALRTNMRAVLEEVTLADLRDGVLPPEVMELTEVPDAWTRR